MPAFRVGIPESQKGAASGVASLDSDQRVVEDPARRVFPLSLGVPGSLITAWDDFADDSADLDARSTPNGVSWGTVDDDGAAATGVASVADGEAAFTSTAAVRWARLPISSANGLLLLATVRKTAMSSTVIFRYGVWDANGDYVAIDARRTTGSNGIRLVKKVSGTETTLATENATEYGDAGTSNAALIQPVRFGVQELSTGSIAAVGYDHPSAPASFRVTDADALSVIENATHVALAVYRDGYISSVRVLEAG